MELRAPPPCKRAVMKAPRRIFLKEFLKENYDRLWNIFESFTR